MANPEHEAALRRALGSQAAGVDLSGLDLSGVLIPSARLEGANLGQADLRGSELAGGYFKNCNFSGAQLRKARITVADLRGADLSNADLTSADLNSSVLSGAALTNANLAKASLVRATVDQVDFSGANLDRTDFRGAKGLTERQLASARNGDKAILDEQMLAALGRQGDRQVARHGRPTRKRPPNIVDLAFLDPKPHFGDIFLLCGRAHPNHAATGHYAFQDLADLGIEQVDDYFAICADGDPVIWLFPLVKGSVVEHHPGPFDGIRLELADASRAELFRSCLSRFREVLGIAES